MLSKKMESVLNEQINREMYSAYLYMAMSNYMDGEGLKGFSKWFMVQYHEEMYHAMKIYEHVQRRGGTPELQSIEKPPAEFGTPMEAFNKTLEHEQFITKSINELYNLAAQEKDYASQNFLQWYVDEQVEEEENDNDIIAQLKLIGDKPQALIMLDRELGARACHAPLDFSVGVEAQTQSG